MGSHNLTPPELAVLVNHMTGGRFLESASSLDDLQLDEQGLAQVEERLLDQGLLICPPSEEVPGVTSRLASVLSAALTPDRVCIVRTVHEDHGDAPVFYSFTPECITSNTVDDRGQHVFTELADLEEVASSIVAAGNASPSPAAPTRKATDKKGAVRSQPRPLLDVLGESHRLVMLLAVANPAEEASSVAGLTWLDTKEGSWVVGGAGSEEVPQAVPISAAELRQRIRACLGEAGEAGTRRRARG